MQLTPYIGKGKRMRQNDLNQLIALEALLAEGSVAGAARRLGLSGSAMSRSLARLRESTGDPLLVRAGRGLVPTPRAQQLRDEVARLVREAAAVLNPQDEADPANLVRDFTLRCSEGFVENFGSALIEALAAQAPGVRLSFLPKPDKDSALLRAGRVDLETGVVGEETSPELRVRALFRDRFIGVTRADHPLAAGAMTAARFAEGRHLQVSRRGRFHGGVDEALAALGLRRQVAASVGGFAAALALVRESGLITVVPERHTGNLRRGLFSFPLPLDVPGITVSLHWHPRMDADPAHRWLRERIHEVCAAMA